MPLGYYWQVFLCKALEHILNAIPERVNILYKQMLLIPWKVSLELQGIDLASSGNPSLQEVSCVPDL